MQRSLNDQRIPTNQCIYNGCIYRKKKPSLLLNLFYILKKSNPFVFSLFFVFLHSVFVFIFTFSLKLNKIDIKTVIILRKINDGRARQTKIKKKSSSCPCSKNANHLLSSKFIQCQNIQATLAQFILKLKAM